MSVFRYIIYIRLSHKQFPSLRRICNDERIILTIKQTWQLRIHIKYNNIPYILYGNGRPVQWMKGKWCSSP